MTTKHQHKIGTYIIWELDSFVYSHKKQLVNFLKDKSNVNLFQHNSNILINNYCTLLDKPKGKLTLNDCIQLNTKLTNMVLVDKLESNMKDFY